jgi:hypothetical protein
MNNCVVQQSMCITSVIVHQVLLVLYDRERSGEHPCGHTECWTEDRGRGITAASNAEREGLEWESSCYQLGTSKSSCKLTSVKSPCRWHCYDANRSDAAVAKEEDQKAEECCQHKQRAWSS